MRPDLDLIPARWQGREPPGLCHTGLEAIAAAASIGGTLISAKAGMDQAEHAANVAENETVALRQRANEEAAAGQRAAIQREREANLLASRARAAGAASGMLATSPDLVDIEGDIAGQGAYNAAAEIYGGAARERAARQQAEIRLFDAQRTRSAAPVAAFGTLLSGVGSWAEKPSSKKLLDLFGKL